MSSFPRSPKVAKGAIIGIDVFNPVASVTVFQYNPDSVSRTLQIQGAGDQGARSEALRVSGAPAETLKFEIEIDATDQLETDDSVATSLGIYPQLSALEMLIYPKSAQVIANTVALAIGTIEVIPFETPLTLLIWGRKRIVPVRVTEFSITEDAHDVNLNPIRAKVSLGLRVLSYSDLPITHPGYGVFLAHQVVKEALAVVGSAGNLGSVSGTGGIL